MPSPCASPRWSLSFRAVLLVAGRADGHLVDCDCVGATHDPSFLGLDTLDVTDLGRPVNEFSIANVLQLAAVDSGSVLTDHIRDFERQLESVAVRHSDRFALL